MKLKSFGVKCSNVDQVEILHNKLTELGCGVYADSHSLSECIKDYNSGYCCLGLEEEDLKVLQDNSPAFSYTEELSFEDAIAYLGAKQDFENITSQGDSAQTKLPLSEIMVQIEESKNKPLTISDVQSMIGGDVSSIEIREGSFIVTSEYTDRTYKVSDQEGLIELVGLLKKLGEYEEV